MAARARPERDLLPVQRRNICCQEPEIPTGRNFPWRPSVFRRCCGQQGVAQVLAQRGRAAATSPLPERVPHRWLHTVALPPALLNQAVRSTLECVRLDAALGFLSALI